MVYAKGIAAIRYLHFMHGNDTPICGQLLQKIVPCIERALNMYMPMIVNKIRAMKRKGRLQRHARMNEIYQSLFGGLQSESTLSPRISMLDY